eukprot:TRINITY_DN677_c1_g1_i2.p1 TRINITY_DN677_c1_g1~~TRINITY_DN677_c1_g1_i2.p1  ORF type:complete len:112 (+),score=11.08 TRINITY_DN677_c1_g1_i2:30-365(+)
MNSLQIESRMDKDLRELGGNSGVQSDCHKASLHKPTMTDNHALSCQCLCLETSKESSNLGNILGCRKLTIDCILQKDILDNFFFSDTAKISIVELTDLMRHKIISLTLNNS